MPALVRRSGLRRGVSVLTYHEVLPGADVEAWTIVAQEQFHEQCRYLRRHAAVVSIDEAIEDLERGRSRHVTAVLTFDDGYSGNASAVLPVVESLGLPIAVFVSTSWIGTLDVYWYDQVICALAAQRDVHWDLRDHGLGCYTWRAREDAGKRWRETQRALTDLKELSPVARDALLRRLLERTAAPWPLRALDRLELSRLAASRLVTIGAHSHGHERLSRLSADQARASVVTSKRLLESWLSKPVVHFAYPNGDHGPRVEAIVRDAGFRTGFSARRGLWRRGESPFRIPRIGVGRYDSIGAFKLKTAGIVV